MPTRAATDLDLIRGTLGDPKTGVLGAVVPNGQVFIPGGPVTFAPLSTLRWEVRGASFKVPDREMFDSFIGLWQEPGSDERIRQFAESWGPLAIQRDGTHLGADKWERINSEVGWYGWDSLAVWKYFSRRAYSVLKIATELQHGRRGNEREWLMLSSPQKAGREPTCPQAPFGFGNWARRELVNIRRRDHREIHGHARPDEVIVENLLHNLIREIGRVVHVRSAGGDIPPAFLELRRHLEAHFAERIVLADLACRMHCSVPHFCAEFKRHFQTSAIEFVIRLRLHRAHMLLRDHNVGISAIAAEVGYDDIHHFSKLFRKRYGMSPRAMRAHLATN